MSKFLVNDDAKAIAILRFSPKIAKLKISFLKTGQLCNFQPSYGD